MPIARSGRPCNCAAAPTSSARGACCNLSRHFLKFALKEPIIPDGANKGVFILAPLVMGTLSIAAWAVIPVAEGWAVADINVGILYIFAISSLGVYGVIMGGWASNSKYPFMSALRSAAQMVSYEVSIGFVIITVLLCAGSLNLTDIVEAQDTKAGFFGWYWLPLFPMFIIFFISALAETNRPPFDLVEAESELVAGFMVEYSARRPTCCSCWPNMWRS
jgi:NADH-quinone oxidoreductase subunit H